MQNMQFKFVTVFVIHCYKAMNYFLGYEAMNNLD